MELRDGYLLLRAWRKEDAEVVYEECRDPETQRWLPTLPRPYTLTDAYEFVTGALDLGGPQYAITEDGAVVGSIGIRLGADASGHIGYWCTRGARGRGVATRALRRLCRHALEDLRLERLELFADPENVASQRVAEKVGFRREGVLRSHLCHPDGRRRDSVVLSLLPGELR